MMVFLNQVMAEDDELTARRACCLLAERWPTFQVSLPTLKRVCKNLGWVCTRPHYCQLLRDVSFYYVLHDYTLKTKMPVMCLLRVMFHQVDYWVHHV